MPLHEFLPITVTLTVGIGNHTLNFTRAGKKASGALYEGRDPSATGTYTSDDCLENAVRESVQVALGKVGEDAMAFLIRAYPVYADEVTK